jgi:uncharacterized membrane protein (DUF2068 family)
LSARQRPGSVTLLVTLQILLGVLFLFGVFALAVASFRLEEVVPHIRFLPLRSSFVVILLLLLGAIEFVLAYGLWNRMSWAWGASLVLAVLGIIFFVFSLFLRPGFGEIASLIIDLLVLYCLMQPRVHAYLKGSKAAPS